MELITNIEFGRMMNAAAQILKKTLSTSIN
ncbi:hypothetical protein Q757_08670 [Oenococcus alcoholitolerans]|uniref:Uncharacterized protein n=1 Tax=Oenococcus alcoholitolerans TaxID=931074 RepID=A0ABR4XPT6_9LACO|nr:hypothetical protein Q757_08670 [Oenococcus alcoholitolerans]